MSGFTAAIILTGTLLEPVPVQRPRGLAPSAARPPTITAPTTTEPTADPTAPEPAADETAPAPTDATQVPTGDDENTDTDDAAASEVDPDAGEEQPAALSPPEPKAAAPVSVPARKRVWDEEWDPSATKPKRWPDPLRKGILLQGGIGFARCGQDQCKSLKAAAWFDFTGGYRFGRFVPVLRVAGGRGPLTVSDVATEPGDVQLEQSTASLGFLYVGAGTLLHLVMRSRFDPYVGLTLGYFQSRYHVSGNGSIDGDPPQAVRLDYTATARRGAIGVVLGLGFLLGKRWTLGPRFEAIVPFAGDLCTRNFSAKPTCDKLSKTEFDVAQFFPRPWTFSAQLGVLI